LPLLEDLLIWLLLRPSKLLRKAEESESEIPCKEYVYSNPPKIEK
jgi:hypothetical protein